MKRKVLAGLVLAGVIGISGAASAEVSVKININVNDRKIAVDTQQQKPRPPEPPENISGRRPPMSRDIRNDDRQNRHGRHEISRDKRPPMPPRSGDKRPGDRKPPERPERNERIRSN